MQRSTLPLGQLIPHLLRSCVFFHQLKQIHGLLLTSSLSLSPTLSSLLLRRATELGSMPYAERLFSSPLHPPHVLLHNAMIRGYAHHGPYENALHLFDEMPLRGLAPNSFTYPYLISACARLGSSGFGKKLHCRVIKDGFDGVPVIGSSLLNFYLELDMSDARRVFDGLALKSVGLWNKMIAEYVNFGDIDSAREVFDGMPERDVVSWNAMLSGYVKSKYVEEAKELFQRMPKKDIVSWTAMVRALADSGDLRGARKLFDEMPERNVVSWNCMLASYTQNGKFRQALDLFLRMRLEKVAPDGYTAVSALSACAHLGDLKIGKWIHFNLINSGLRLEAIIGTSLVEMYSKCGDIDRALLTFLKMITKDVFCWNVMIKALATHGKCEDAMKLFALLKREGLVLNDYTFMGILFACSHGGLVEEGKKIFDSMEREFRVRPKIEHFGCLIDMLCRDGRVEEAKRVIKEMPYKPDIAIWGALLGGCRVSNDVESINKVIEGITQLETEEGGVYALVSNIYAGSSQWNEAESAREKMEDGKVWKSTGCSVVLEGC
uniref:Pentatricopeptide repeat-containing protein n=1 Tax=Ananas comosus var. bracteatus TaxID=296719 RepID=A0A6V7NQZ6_ANACO|nr:unnamed protein product [Ananas comosus var. bracteatus]